MYEEIKNQVEKMQDNNDMNAVKNALNNVVVNEPTEPIEE